MPADLEDALAASPSARERFWSLPPDQLDRWVGYVERARLPGARRRRIADTVRRLGGRPVATEAVALPRRDRWAWLVGLALLAALAAFLVWLTLHRHQRSASPAAVVVTATSKVPAVEGIKLQAAEFQLREAKLSVGVVRRHAAKPRDIVLAQRPKPPRRVVQGSLVMLVVSKGPAGVRLPKLVGLAAADAVRALQSLGLTATLQQVAAPGAPGTVVSQAPAPRTRAKRGSTVRLRVVQGAPQQAATTATATTAPPATTAVTTTAVTTAATTTQLQQSPAGNDYRGMRLATAVQRIASGRQQVVVRYVASTKPAGVVVANAAAGAKVELQVSAGPRPQPAAAVPDTTGEDASTAQGDLTAAGFPVIVAQWPVSDPASDGVVVDRTPARAPRGAQVVIYVGAAK